MIWSITFPSPNYTLCTKNKRNTSPHLLSTFNNQYLKGLIIVIHNKSIHLIAHTLQTNKFTRFFTFVNIETHDSSPPASTTPNWILSCTYTNPPCLCLSKLRPHILCILGAPEKNQTPITPPMPTHSNLLNLHIVTIDTQNKPLNTNTLSLTHQ